MALTPTGTIALHLVTLGCYAAEQADRAEGLDSEILSFLAVTLRETVTLAREAQIHGDAPTMVPSERHGVRTVVIQGCTAGKVGVLRALPGGRQGEPSAPAGALRLVKETA